MKHTTILFNWKKVDLILQNFWEEKHMETIFKPWIISFYKTNTNFKTGFVYYMVAKHDKIYNYTF